MAYVIAEPCIGTKDTACVDVCPVDCIHPRKDEANFESETQLYIHPTECIDCGACVPVCPVTPIFALEDLPEKWNSFTPINADWYAKQEKYPGLARRNRSFKPLAPTPPPAPFSSSSQFSPRLSHPLTTT